ncbi:acyl-CoA thioesterase [Bermanella sp. WJH001]|uniref:acyl-CoA thioesterase n=1 Tax=Bermanella sp. WJH001 TaxID=3048005 RepID=UPI0024BE97FF|nr:acyl-CoA thioesterase [Bermanella sp. WJH001]MDJ1537198.1 acyl-CoA thioesterase [Bermanella sp. WJH001]
MRIRLDLPQTVLFSMEISVRVTDVNYAGHLGNDRLLVYAQEVRSAWFASLGFNELNIEGCNTIMADAALQYVNEAFANDSLTITLFLGEQHKYGFDLYYLVARGEDEICKMKTAILFQKNGALSAPPSSLFN